MIINNHKLKYKDTKNHSKLCINKMRRRSIRRLYKIKQQLQYLLNETSPWIDCDTESELILTDLIEIDKKIHSILHDEGVSRNPVLRLPARTIDSFSDSECYRRFRIMKGDLTRVMKLLKVPTVIRLQNGSKFQGEEVFLFSLNRFTSCAPLADMVPVYGRDVTQWNRAFHWFVQHILENFSYLLTDMFQFWKPYIPLMAEKIRLKLLCKEGLYYPPGLFKVFSFLDYTVIATQRPGGGPVDDGENASRYNNFIQMAFYNGWKHHHGIKYQSIETPLGICMHLYGPRSFQRCDLKLLCDSRVIDKIRELLAEWPPHKQFALYGDGIYPRLSHLVCRFGGCNATQLQDLENQGIPWMRISNEWDYGITVNAFPYIKFRCAMKVRTHKDIAQYYFVATILRNICAILYGNQTYTYFECDDDELEDKCSILLEDYLDEKWRPKI